MDGIGTIVFLIIAAAFSIINNKAQKKAKEEAARRKAAASKSDTPPVQNPLEDFMKTVLGEELTSPKIPYDKETAPDSYMDEAKPQMEPILDVVPESKPIAMESSMPEAASEDSLYPQYNIPQIDIPDAVSDYDYDYNYNEQVDSIEEFNYNSLDLSNLKPLPDAIAQSENQVTKQAESPVADFDPIKAIIYSEIITPKYI